MCFFYLFFLKTERARSVSDGPPKRSWSVCRPHVVWTLTFGLAGVVDLATGVFSQEATLLDLEDEAVEAVEEAIVLG